ncbi:hypothetical protein ABWH92_09695 [Ahrensia marina]|uniref:hypothetical protein n=1 Tax=Ahrensia marina TaxID=1514904 RepID=UPI0035CE9D8E
MTDWALLFDPLIPLWLVIVASVFALVLTGLGLWARRRGALLRAAAMAIVIITLLDPSVRLEERDRLPTVVALVSDESASQSIDGRDAMVASAADALRPQLEALGNVDVRTIALGTDPQSGTRALGSIQAELADVPQEQLGGILLLTDGQITDAPIEGATTPLTESGAVPVHTLLTGHAEEGDRRIELLQVPRFALVDRRETVQFTIVEDGMPLSSNPNPTVNLTILRNNTVLAQAPVPVGVTVDVPIQVDRAGDNLFEIRIEPADNELTDLNNQAVFSVEGVRDTLRVLLVSGEPHAGERTWRNLLKSDPSVDLVHFTILRPPEKQDGTPINELSLIAFPTRELFVDRINDFDLIILDRYQRRSVLPLVYFDNIADYVRRGGALLVAAGPEFADTSSIAFTALADILPAYPTGSIAEEPFRPQVTDLGRRHPITRGLPGDVSGDVAGDGDGDPDWSRWFRLIEAEASSASTVAMSAPASSSMPGAPLLALDSAEEGRVALLLSDHVWLWARNFEGGGPHVQLLRRMAHWLMREPDLEDETLTARTQGLRMIVERRTLGQTVDPLRITTPSGEEIPLELTDEGDGLFRGSLPADEIGLWRITDGTLTTLAHVGPPNPVELQEVVSTPERLMPLTEASNGSLARLTETQGDEMAVPRVRLVGETARTSGNGWIGVRRTDASVLVGARQQPLSLGLWALLPALALWGAAWWREGR